MRPFDKPALTIPAQIELLKGRGLSIRDDARAAALLEVVSLFRLSPYMRSFQQNPDHRFRQGTTLADIVTLYRFDRELRNLVMDAVERVEVAARACISNVMATRYHDPHWYLRRELFKDNYDHARLLGELREKMDEERRHFAREQQRIERSQVNEVIKRQRIERRKRDNYFRFYGHTYNAPDLPPSWAVLEVLSMGALSRLYQGIARDADRKLIAARFQLPQHVLGSWLHTFTFVRNCCAHHARLWNRELAIPPKIPSKAHWHWPDTRRRQPHPERRIFVVLLMLVHLMRHVSPDSHWQTRLDALLKRYPEVPLTSMGFVEHWRELLIWREVKQ
ncbi:MAG: Abi family protein [Bacteroidetes bacterium]|nr:MAG: Abi family protein [Bacteroidota bacterium]